MRTSRFNSLKRKAALVVIVCLFMVCMTANAFALDISDISGHWAKDTIQSWVDQGLIKGYEDGSFKPDNNITRAEFITLVNGAFGYTEQGNAGFADVGAGAWYADAVQKAQAAGYIAGYPDNTMRPDNPISREEAASIIQRLTKFEGNPKNNLTYTDASSLAWSRDSVRAVSESGLMQGYPDGSFKPQNLIKRGEAVEALNAALNYSKTSIVYDKPGTYGPATGVLEVAGDVIVLSEDVKLQNILIKGNLIVGKAVGDGDVTLENIVVEGESRFYGGGENSIIIIDSTLGDVFIYKEDGKIRLVISGETSVDQIISNSSAILENRTLGGGFQEIILDAEDDDVIILIGNFERVIIATPGLEVQIPSGTTVGNLILNEAADITGNGTVKNAEINANGISFEKAPQNTEVADGIDEPEIEKPAPATGGGGGGGGGSYTVVVSAITVSGADGATTIKLIDAQNEEIVYGENTLTVTIPANEGDAGGGEGGE